MYYFTRKEFTTHARNQISPHHHTAHVTLYIVSSTSTINVLFTCLLSRWSCFAVQRYSWFDFVLAEESYCRATRINGSSDHASLCTILAAANRRLCICRRENGRQGLGHKLGSIDDDDEDENDHGVISRELPIFIGAGRFAASQSSQSGGEAGKQAES